MVETIPIRILKKSYSRLPECKQIFCRKKTSKEAEDMLTNMIIIDEVIDFYIRTKGLI